MSKIRYGSVCSGIEAATMAWQPLGWECAFVAEIEPFPCAVLKERHPAIPNLGDVNDLCVDISAKLLFSVPHAKSQEELCPGRGNVPGWNVCGGCGGFLWRDPPINVGLAENSGREVSAKHKKRKQKPLSSKRGEAQQGGDSGGGKSDKKEYSDTTVSLRDVRQKLCSCQQQAADRGASLRLQQAIGGDVVVPGVPFQVASGTQGHTVDISNIDVLIGGFPCQDLSVAGKRKGLVDENGKTTRSGLFYRICELADAIGQRWTVLENVPGIFSSNGGRDFAAVVGEMAGCEINVPKNRWLHSGVALGPKGLVEWFVLDAQWRGLAQRRKRVFIIRDSGNWADRPPFFPLTESLLRNPPPSREKGEGVAHDVAPCIGASGRGFDRTGDTRGQDCVIPIQEIGKGQSGTHVNGVGHGKNGDPMYTLQAGSCHGIAVTHSLRTDGFDASEDGTGRGTPLVPEVAWALQERDSSTKNGHLIPAMAFERRMTRTTGGQPQEELSHCLNTNTGDGAPCVATPMAVRRLTPRECERLQGFTPVIDRVMFLICLDHQKHCANVEIKCLKSPNVASLAGDKRNLENAKSADKCLLSGQENSACAVAAHVRLSPGAELQAIHSAGKLIWSADFAAIQSVFPLHIRPESFAQLLAPMLQMLDQIIPGGRGASPAIINLSILPGNGSSPAGIFGPRKEVNAKDADVKLAGGITSTTSSLGRRIDIYKQTDQIWLCSVLNAIALFIPKEIANVSSCKFSVDIESDYTLIPYRKKPAADCPDGPRYKALGNSMAVPVIRWIGEHIQAVDQIGRVK